MCVNCISRAFWATLHAQESIEWFTFVLALTDLDNSVRHILGWLDRSCDSKNNRVVVGNIHVLFNPKRGDVKLGQVMTSRNPRFSCSKSHEIRFMLLFISHFKHSILVWIVLTKE